MIMENLLRNQGRVFAAPNKHRCPNCKDTMAEVHRVKENGVSFIWYACPRHDCDGQWLEKRAVAIEAI